MWRPGRSLSIRARLTLYYAAVLALILAALGTFLVVALRNGLYERAHDSLEAAYRPLAQRITQSGQPPDLAGYLHGTQIGNEAELEVIGQLLDARGRVVRSSGAPGTRTPMVGPDVLAEAARAGHWHEPRRLRGRPRDDIVVVFPIRSGALRGSSVVFAQSLRAAQDAVRRVVWLLLLATPVALALALVGGLRVAQLVVGPLDRLTRTAAAIDVASADERLPEPDRDDELGRLARTLNGMLERLGRAMTRERRFAADTSHELRTPLAVMAAELDVALRRDVEPRARETLLSVREEVGHLSRLVEHLLLISRADGAAGVELARRDTDLLDLAIGVVARLQPVAQARGVTLALDGAPAHALVDPDLMDHALRNLVENAIRHGGPPGPVTVTVHDGDRPVITVADHGVGIPAAELDQIFERFHRVDRARSREHGGAGLGLAITRAVVEAHGGRVDVESRLGEGSTFTIVLGGDRDP